MLKKFIKKIKTEEEGEEEEKKCKSCIHYLTSYCNVTKSSFFLSLLNPMFQIYPCNAINDAIYLCFKTFSVFLVLFKICISI